MSGDHPKLDTLQSVVRDREMTQTGHPAPPQSRDCPPMAKLGIHPRTEVSTVRNETVHEATDWRCSVDFSICK